MPSRGMAGLAAAVGDMAGYFLWPLKATPTAPMGSAIVLLGLKLVVIAPEKPIVLMSNPMKN